MKRDYGLTMRGIIKNSDGEILILKRHPKSRTDPDTWELPGGKMEAGEFFDDALVREIKEETNLDCKVGDLAIAIQHDYPYKRTVQMIMYLDNVEGEFRISEEHTDGRYASIDEIKTLKLSSCLQKVLEKKDWAI
ncbi:MAG: NUDIX domain-containing protein [Methanobrevibacter sp.]|nr:NUDIX domain-containing protein [Methanobrevibacter sp.]